MRQRAGLFDLSHMGELLVEGREASAALAYALLTDPPALAVGRAHYSMICAPDGGDHRRPHRLPAGRRPLPGRRQRDATRRSWPTRCRRASPASTPSLDDASLRHVAGRPPGPAGGRGPDAAHRRGPGRAALLRHRRGGRVAGVPALVARTGYTGEDGFEVFVAWDDGAGSLGRAAGRRRPGRARAGRAGGARHAAARGGDAALRQRARAGHHPLRRRPRPGGQVHQARRLRGPRGARGGRRRPAARRRSPASSSAAAGSRGTGTPSSAGRRRAGRRGHQRHPVADARRADRDGIRPTGRRAGRYDARRGHP